MDDNDIKIEGVTADLPEASEATDSITTAEAAEVCSAQKSEEETTQESTESTQAEVVSEAVEAEVAQENTEDAQAEVVSEAIENVPTAEVPPKEGGAATAAEEGKQDEAAPEMPISEAPTETKEELDEDAKLSPEDQAIADEQAIESALAGFSEDKDAYGREILEPTFENILIMSKNSLKLNYSRIKNAILCYREIFSRYEDDSERFLYGKRTLFYIRLNGDQILVYLALEKDSIDHKVYPHRYLRTEELAQTPILVTVNKLPSLNRILELINLVMDKNGITKRKSYENKTFAEDHPINPNGVLRGNENIAPIEGFYQTEEYEDIFGELTKKVVAENIVEKKKRGRKKKPTGEQILNKQRQTAKTIKGAVALTEPIVYFYDTGVERDNTVAYIAMQQVLNDKFLGKLVPQMYFAVAEGSERIEELNLLALNEITADCDRNPDKKFCINISCRMLIRQASLKKLLAAVKTEHNNLIIALDCVLLEALGDIGERGVKALQDENVSLMADNTESAGMKILTEYSFDYLRFDARYYKEETPSKNAHLDMVTGFAKVQGIKTTTLNVGTQKEAVYFLTHGIDIIQGDAVCPPKRLISLVIKSFKKLPPVAK